MSCAQSSVELTSLMDGELPRERAAELNRHLAKCGACRRGLRTLKQAASLVGALAAVASPADLRDRVARKAAEPRAVGALTCAGAREMLDDYAHGHLAQGQAGNVEAHLCDCDGCSRELGLLEQSVGLLRALPEIEPPARIRREAARRSCPAYARPAWRGMIATAGVAVAAAVVLLALRIPGSQPPTTATEQPARAASAVTAAPAPAPHDAEPSAARVATPLPGAATKSETSPTPAPRRVEPARSTVWSTRARGVAGTPAPTSTTAAPILAVRHAGHSRVTAGGAPETGALPRHAGIAYAEPAVSPEPATVTAASSTPGEAREVVVAAMVPATASPLSEVRRALREQGGTEPPTLRPRHERDRFASGPIPKWGF
jgi:anti-sigma factor RsiW